MRKILLLLISAALLAGCSLTRPSARMVNTIFLDYRPYTTEGFFISPNSYNGEHDVLGELSIDITPALIPFSKVEKSEFPDGIYKTFGGPKVVKEEIYAEEILEIAVSKAVELGGNGLSNFSAKRIFDINYNSGVAIKTLSHYEIRGVVIRSK